MPSQGKMFESRKHISCCEFNQASFSTSRNFSGIQWKEAESAKDIAKYSWVFKPGSGCDQATIARPAMIPPVLLIYKLLVLKCFNSIFVDRQLQLIELSFCFLKLTVLELLLNCWCTDCLFVPEFLNGFNLVGKQISRTIRSPKVGLLAWWTWQQDPLCQLLIRWLWVKGYHCDADIKK